MTGDRRGARAAGLAVSATLLLAGCGQDTAEPDREGSTTPSSSSPTGTPPESPGEEPSQSGESPSVEPAAGPLVKQPSFVVRAPEGWVKDAAGPFTKRYHSEELLSDLATEQVPSHTGSVDAAFREESGPYDPAAVERLPDVTLGGLPAYHYVLDSSSVREHVYGGVIDDGDTFVVRFQFARMATDKAQALEIVDSVLASFELR